MSRNRTHTKMRPSQRRGILPTYGKRKKLPSLSHRSLLGKVLTAVTFQSGLRLQY